MTELSPNSLNANLKIVKTEIKPTGEAIQVVRPLVSSAKTTDQIVGELVNRFDYRTGEVKASENELNTVQQAFGSNLANELIKTYEGSNLVSDSQQDLVGDKYLAEQIRMIQEQQKTTSILDKWGHLLYEGERDYKSSVGTGGAGTGSKTSLNAQSTGGTVSGGGYMNTYSNGSIAHYNQLIEQHQQQQQQLQQEQEQQQEIIQQFHEQLQQEQQELQDQPQQAPQSTLRSSQSGNLVSSNSNHRLLAAVNSQNGIGSYAQSQSGLQSRTLSEVRLQAQLRAQLEAQAQARAQAQLQAQLQAQAQSQAQALAHARAVEHARQQHQQQQLNRSMSNSLANGVGVEVRSAIGVAAAPVNSHSQSQHQSQQLPQQQPQPFLPQLSSNNLKSVTLEAYNSPQFKAMLEQLSKPISVPPEQINYPPEWPSQDKINSLAEPIYIPAPQPIVIPAPNIITIESQPIEPPTFSRHDLPDAAVKPTVTYYPSISTDQAHMKNFGIRQLNLDTNLNRTASVLNQAQQPINSMNQY